MELKRSQTPSRNERPTSGKGWRGTENREKRGGEGGKGRLYVNRAATCLTLALRMKIRKIKTEDKLCRLH